MTTWTKDEVLTLLGEGERQDEGLRIAHTLNEGIRGLVLDGNEALAAHTAFSAMSSGAFNLWKMFGKEHAQELIASMIDAIEADGQERPGGED